MYTIYPLVLNTYPMPASQVSHIKANTKIPVLGHADGICHIYVDAAADIKTACSVVLDSKVRQRPAS